MATKKVIVVKPTEEKKEEVKKTTKTTSKKSTAKKTATKKATPKKKTTKKATKTTAKKTASKKTSSKKADDVVKTPLELVKKNHIIPINEEEGLKFKTQGEKIREVYDDLKDAIREKRVVSGKVASVVPKGDEVCAVIIYKGLIKVYINVDLFMYPEEINTIPDIAYIKDEKSKQFRALSIRIGSDIDFIITKVSEDSRTAIGNRISARQIKQTQAYISKNYQTGKSKLEKGSIAEGRIVYVCDNSMCVEVRGFEKVLKVDDITTSRLASLRDKYMAGDNVPVLIKDVIKDKTGKIVTDVVMSVKEAETDDVSLYIDNCEEGMDLICQVMQVNKYGVFCHSNEMNMDILCNIGKGKVAPMKFKMVKVHITKVDKNLNRVFGIITLTY